MYWRSLPPCHDPPRALFSLSLSLIFEASAEDRDTKLNIDRIQNTIDATYSKVARIIKYGNLRKILLEVEGEKLIKNLSKLTAVSYGASEGSCRVEYFPILCDHENFY